MTCGTKFLSQTWHWQWKYYLPNCYGYNNILSCTQSNYNDPYMNKVIQMQVVQLPWRIW